MNIDLEFLPAVIVFFCCSTNPNGVGREEIWGDETFWRNVEDFFSPKLRAFGRPGFICIEKGTLEYKIFPGWIED